MTKTTHTPGRWAKSQNLSDSVHSSACGLIAVVYGRNVPEIKANTALISAAPDLLAALKGVLVDMERRAKARGDTCANGRGVVLDCGSGVLYAMDQAIAKAEGGAE